MQIWAYWFQICSISEVKFGNNLSKFSQFKQIQVRLLQEEATEKESIDFVDFKQLD